MDISATIAADIAANPLAWPGLYPRYAITDDGGIICPSCCKSELALITESTPRDGWHVVAEDVNYEHQLWCSNCASRIPAAYLDEDNED